MGVTIGDTVVFLSDFNQEFKATVVSVESPEEADLHIEVSQKGDLSVRHIRLDGVKRDPTCTVPNTWHFTTEELGPGVKQPKPVPQWSVGMASGPVELPPPPEPEPLTKIDFAHLVETQAEPETVGEPEAIAEPEVITTDQGFSNPPVKDSPQTTMLPGGNNA